MSALETGNKKCNAYSMCEFLAARITGHGSGGKGFHAIHTLEMSGPSGGPTTFQGVSFKTNAADNGLMLNFCPFCGGRPGAAMQPKVVAAAKAITDAVERRMKSSSPAEDVPNPTGPEASQ